MLHRSWGQRSSRPRAISLGSDRQIGGSTLSVITRTAAIAALLLASACSGQPEVLEPDPTSTTSSRSTTPPAKPDAAAEDSPSGAATFVLFWVETAHYASITGEIDVLEEISTDDCVSCSALISNLSETYARGGSFSGGARSLDDVSVEESDETRDLLVHTVSNIAKSTHRRSSSASAEPIPAESSRVSYRVTRIGSEWRMKEFALDE